jgi:hypothetical protein
MGMINGVEFDSAVNWFVPIVSIFLTKHVVMTFVRRQADQDASLRIFMIVSCIIAAGFVLTTVGITFGGFMLAPGAYGVQSESGLEMVTRSVGFWGDATVAGIVVTSLLFLPHVKWNPATKIAYAAGQIAMVLLSGKRLAVLSLAGVVGFLFIGAKGRYRRAPAIALAVLAIGAMWYFLPRMGILDRFGEAAEAISGERAEDQRIQRFTFAIDTYLQNPILGAGGGKAVFIHNGILELIADVGLLAIPVLIALILPIWRGYKSPGISKTWAKAAIVYMLSPFMLEAVLNRPENLAFLGFFLGMIEASARIEWRRSQYRMGVLKPVDRDRSPESRGSGADTGIKQTADSPDPRVSRV